MNRPRQKPWNFGKILILAGLGLILSGWSNYFWIQPDQFPTSVFQNGAVQRQMSPLGCVAFGPYVDDLDPNQGPHPKPALIDSLLDKIVEQTDFGCIMTYGVLNGLDYTFEAAKARGLKVIAIIWLGADQAVNRKSITLGLEKAKQYPDTIIRLSCGSEVRRRLGAAIAEPIIRNCLDQVKQAEVPQPVTSIDTWWSWCNEAWPCQPRTLADAVDWIGVNVYAWWENRGPSLFPCIPAADAANFHLNRLLDVAATYSDHEVILTEFGWPAGPENNDPSCPGAEASARNQTQVALETLAQLDQVGRLGVVFEAFDQGDWKLEEGPVGAFWGVIPADITGIVQLQGRTDHSGSHIFLSEEPCSSFRSSEPIAVTDARGRFDIAPFFGRSYHCLQIVRRGYLVGQMSFPAANVGTLTLPAGDVNQDNQIDILDIAVIAAHYDTNDPQADVNGSGLVDILDLAIVAKNYQRLGPVTNWR